MDGMFSLSVDETRLYDEQRRDHVSLVQVGDGQGEAALNITFVSTYANVLWWRATIDRVLVGS
ncbi:MAG: hypothetical protein M3680_06355 [Myxococcota bacterium]|nr:hypothetical protein [Myxococcota bacterium]